MLRIAFFVLAVGLALTAFNLRGLLPDVPVAEQSPADCLSELSAVTASVSAPGTVVPLTRGQEVGFRVGAGLPPDPAGVACSLVRADVYLQLPGARSFRLICRIDTLDEGEKRLCPQRILYVADPADVTGSVIVARVRVIADIADDAFECIVPAHKRDPRRMSNCLDATGLSVLGPVLR